MRQAMILAAAIALAGVVALPIQSPSALAAPVQPALQGVYAYAQAESDDIGKAIEKAVSQMNMFVRPIAHGRLEGTNKPYLKITIAHNKTEVTITTDVRAPIVTPANGTPIKWKREDGETLDVSTVWKGLELEQTFAAKDGKRVNTYVMGPDGKTMWMKVNVSSPKLPEALTYKVAYHPAK